jgi:Uma2 family endonuclease
MSVAIAYKKDYTLVGVEPYISWEAFQKKYLTREDKYKYEWLNGKIEKTKRAMDFTQLFIARNLISYFRQLLSQGKVNGEIMSEGDIFFLENHRRPDLFYFTDEQLAYTAHGENQVPSFIVEIISKNDNINKVVEKMGNYRAAGVQVVWHLYAFNEEVHVYAGEHLTSMTVLKGDEICSAAPALPAFEMSVNNIYNKPPKP